MGRGYPVTDRELANICRLAGYLTEDGDFRFSYCQIAQMLHLSPQTIRYHVRISASRWGNHVQWRPPDSPDDA